MADETAAKPREGIFSELKIDFPGVLALNIFITFAIVIIISFFIRIPVDGPLGQLLEVLKNIVLLMVGFYFGSSKSSQKKDEAIIGQMAPAKNPPNTPVEAVKPWWDRLTDLEKQAIMMMAKDDPRVSAFVVTAQTGQASSTDLAYLESKNLITTDRAVAIQAS